jgi:hypothetical protein
LWCQQPIRRAPIRSGAASQKTRGGVGPTAFREA